MAARQKMAAMSRKKLREFSSEGTIQILALPKLDSAITMGHKKRIKLLRLCPFSDFFGLCHAQFNENSINKTRSTILVCDLINQHTHLKSGLSEIEEKDSVLEASCSIYIGEIREEDDDADSDQQDEQEEEK